MKKLTLIVAFIAGLSLMVHAQIITKKTPEQRAAHITKVLQKHLNLSSRQANQVHSLILSQAVRIDELKKHSSDRKKTHLMARNIKRDTETKLLTMMNDRQKQQFETLIRIRKEKHKEKKEAKADREMGS